MKPLGLRSRAVALRNVASQLPTIEVVNLLELYARDLDATARSAERQTAALAAYNRIASFQ